MIDEIEARMMLARRNTVGGRRPMPRRAEPTVQALQNAIRWIDPPYDSLLTAQVLFLSAMSEPSSNRSGGESLRRSAAALCEAILAGLPAEETALLDAEWQECPQDAAGLELWRRIETAVIDMARSAARG